MEWPNCQNNSHVSLGTVGAKNIPEQEHSETRINNKLCQFLAIIFFKYIYTLVKIAQDFFVSKLFFFNKSKTFFFNHSKLSQLQKIEK